MPIDLERNEEGQAARGFSNDIQSLALPTVMKLHSSATLAGTGSDSFSSEFSGCTSKQV